MRAASGSQIRFQKIKKFAVVGKNLNNADIKSMPLFAACLVKMERIILFKRNREMAIVFRRRVAKFCENFSRRRKLVKTLIFVVERRL